MNMSKLKNSIDNYKQYLINEAIVEGDKKDRDNRINYYQSITKDKLLKLNEDEFTEYIGKLWASSIYGSKKYLSDKIINENNGFLNIKKLLAEFIFGSDSIDKRWDDFFKKAKYFGPSYMSEILVYYYPEKYALANMQVIKALNYLEFKDMPFHNYKFTGKKYLEICDICNKIKDELNNEKVVTNNLLEVDYFLWEVSNYSQINQKEEKVPKEEHIKNEDHRSIHTEIKEEIVEIGRLLGFDAKAEVKVAKGAIVDAVWSMNIGNMGRVMYVFEVQSKGSIDSLIMNLQKANNNKAVQAVVAVSDSNQLLKIKEESEGLLNELKLWDFEDVKIVYDSLETAMREVNKLGLVPEEFY